jgi:hypothetical protein
VISNLECQASFTVTVAEYSKMYARVTCADGLVGACEVRIDVSTAVVLVQWVIMCINTTKLCSFLL